MDDNKPGSWQQRLYILYIDIPTVVSFQPCEVQPCTVAMCASVAQGPYVKGNASPHCLFLKSRLAYQKAIFQKYSTGELFHTRYRLDEEG